MLERERRALTQGSSPAKTDKAGKEEALFDRASIPRDQYFACAEVRGSQLPALFIKVCIKLRMTWSLLDRHTGLPFPCVMMVVPHFSPAHSQKFTALCLLGQAGKAGEDGMHWLDLDNWIIHEPFSLPFH